MSGFDLEAMKEAVKQCDKNIGVFESAIMKEMNTKMEYQRIVRHLEEQAKNPPIINVEIVREGDEGDE